MGNFIGVGAIHHGFPLSTVASGSLDRQRSRCGKRNVVRCQGFSHRVRRESAYTKGNSVSLLQQVIGNGSANPAVTQNGSFLGFAPG
jgi:hypothetical protein